MRNSSGTADGSHLTHREGLEVGLLKALLVPKHAADGAGPRRLEAQDALAYACWHRGGGVAVLGRGRVEGGHRKAEGWWPLFPPTRVALIPTTHPTHPAAHSPCRHTPPAALQKRGSWLRGAHLGRGWGGQQSVILSGRLLSVCFCPPPARPPARPPTRARLLGPCRGQVDNHVAARLRLMGKKDSKHSEERPYR